MREEILKSPVQRQAKEVSKFYSFLSQTINKIEDLQQTG